MGYTTYSPEYRPGFTDRPYYISKSWGIHYIYSPEYRPGFTDRILTDQPLIIYLNPGVYTIYIVQNIDLDLLTEY